MAMSVQVTPIEQVAEGQVFLNLSSEHIIIDEVTREAGDYLVMGHIGGGVQSTFHVVHAGTQLRIVTRQP